eukprot:GEMP01075645.1.p1 GENE.GEMP01075645.1~~GEMP01075645.1.p1  ORF type:complete len:147 (+),score=38.48 GEMP01075645.1:337-777(+)
MRLHWAYRALQLSPSASPTAVKKAYRRMMLQYHPDRHPGNPERAKANFLVAQKAYEMLLAEHAPPTPHKPHPGPGRRHGAHTHSERHSTEQEQDGHSADSDGRSSRSSRGGEDGKMWHAVRGVGDAILFMWPMWVAKRISWMITAE